MTSLERHVAGATVEHQSPFAELSVPVSHELLPEDIRQEWVKPLYFGLGQPHVGQFLADRLHLATDELVAQMLASVDWRSRTAAAYLVALTDRRGFLTQIGRLLLRSEVCYAGQTYCLVLAELGSSEAVDFLQEYLGYYLRRHELWFDQGYAMAALAYVDRMCESDHLSRHIEDWNKFIVNKPNWNLEQTVAHFEDMMAQLHSLKRLHGPASMP